MKVANTILVLYALYAIFYVPFNATLISAAVGLIVYGALGSFETAVGLTLITGIVFALLVKPTSKRVEGFTTQSNVADITRRVAQMKATPAQAEPQGVFASSFVEGFEDVSGAVNSPSSTPAVPGSTAMNPTSPPAASGANAPPASATAGTATEQAVSSFRSGGSESDSLFKLGVIPEDKKGGFHIDQGTTVINALNSLKPDQLKQMTDDTQKLIDTQKNLMGLLSSVKPMMADGKQMLDTFQQMFGNSAQGNPFA